MPITTSVITGTVAHKHSATGGSSDGGKLATGGLGGDTSFDLSAGSIMYSNGTSLDELIIGSSGSVLTESGGVPTWAAGGGGDACVIPVVELTNGLRKDVPRFGVEVQTNDLSIGKTLTTVSFYLQAGGASGNGNAAVYDSGGSLQATSSNTKNWGTLPSSPNWEKVTFTISHTVAAGDRIVIEGGTTGLGQEVSVNHSPASSEALNQTYPTTYDVDFQACIEYNSASSTWVYQASINSCIKWCYST